MSRVADKRAVRAAALAGRRSMPPEARIGADRAIIARAVRLVRPGARVAAYTPLPREPGGDGLVPALAAVAGELLLPVLRPDLDLDWCPFGTDRALEPDVIATAEVVFVPALAVDTGGVRLGRGGGSYDRALARVAPATPVIALLYGGELHADPLPAEPHDRRVSAVLTPAGMVATAAWITSDPFG